MKTLCDCCNKPCDDKGNYKLRYDYTICWWCKTERARQDGIYMLLGTIAFAVVLLGVWLRGET